MSKKVKTKEKQFNVSFTYYNDVVATCVCGATYQVGSTKESIRVDICANCHPFFTGDSKILDSEGRVEKFNKKYEKFNK